MRHARFFRGINAAITDAALLRRGEQSVEIEGARKHCQLAVWSLRLGFLGPVPIKLHAKGARGPGGKGVRPKLVNFCPPARSGSDTPGLTPDCPN